MRIIKVNDVKEYLQMIYLTEEEVDNGNMIIYNDYSLRDYMDNTNRDCLWDYPIEEKEYLESLEKQKQQFDSDYEKTYVLFCDRLWEIDED